MEKKPIGWNGKRFCLPFWKGVCWFLIEKCKGFSVNKGVHKPPVQTGGFNCHNFITVYSELVHLKHFGHGEEADRVERETVLPPILERSFNAV